MDQASQNAPQKAITKRHKTNRTSLNISRKIVAFEEIARANTTKSSRNIIELLHLPYSTMQTWRAQKTVKDAMEDEVAAFFTTPAGNTLLSRIVGRGRNASYSAPPAQIRTCNISAYGSSLR